MAGLLDRLGRFAARRRWFVLVAWVVVLAACGTGYGLFGGAISSSITIPGTATSKVTDELAKKLPATSGGSGSIVLQTTDGKSFTTAQKDAVDALLTGIGHYPGVRGTVNPFASQAQIDRQRQQIASGRTALAAGTKKYEAAQAQLLAGQKQLNQGKLLLAGQPAALAQLAAQQKTLDAGQAKLDAQGRVLAANKSQLDLGEQLLTLSRNVRLVSKDGSTAVATVQFAKATTEVPQDLKTRIGDAADHAGISGVRINVSNEIAQTAPSVAGPGEIIGLVIAAIVLVLMLRTALGAALPLFSALFGVGVAVLGALAFSSLVQFISVTPILGLMLGLAVGIDYSLFILNRHRTQLKQGMTLHESIGLANGTSGNAVVFAGTTVIVALLALNITGIPFLGLMGTVGAVAVAVAILVAITFTPALLSLVGTRILRGKERAAIGHHNAHEAPGAPMPTWRAVATLVVGIVALGVVALPALHMRLGLPDGSSEATGSTQYQAYTTVEKAFGAGQNGPLLVVANLAKPATGTALLRQEVAIGQAISDQGHVSAVAPIGTSADHTVLAFQVIPTGGPSSESTQQLVNDLRGLSPLATDEGKVTLGVAGNASANIDVSQKLGHVLPIYLVVVVGLSLLILIVVFRSILVPITATVGFVLSLLAAFGGLTAIYQYGWLGSVFGVHDPGPILSFLPILEVGILFGLAMDYQLFLVSGMREAYAHGAPARLAVQRGLHAGRAVVTAAAIIMTSVFAGFIFSDSATIRPIGFGLAFGVLVDAFVVRMLLIPAAMHLLGSAAWWFPKWLDRIVPNVDVEGAELERSQPLPAAQADPEEAKV